jgi:hypothetical protein
MKVLQKVSGEMIWSPNAASQFGDALAKREIYSFDERSVYFPTQTGKQQAVAIAYPVPREEAPLHFNGFSSALVFYHLGIDEFTQQHPDGLVTFYCFPPAKMGG